ncbi:MAG: cysteine desulfurase family protein [bacterium]
MQTNLDNIYLDYAASTPVREEVLEAMLPWLNENFGNPSSIHSHGRKLRTKLDECRDKISNALNCSADEIIFHSGATEGDNWALKSLAKTNQNKGRHFIISGIEHHAVVESAEYLKKNGYEYTLVNPSSDGVVSTEDIQAAIRQDTTFISLMMVNNELGTVQPVEKVARLAKSRDILTHTDCAQAFTTQDIDLQTMPVDILTTTAHKFYGPIGSGFNFVRRDTRIEPLIHGGSHEFGFRAGTENVAGIVGMAKALELAVNERDKMVLKYFEMGNWMLESLKREIPSIQLVGDADKKAPHIYCLRIPGVNAGNLHNQFDAVGISIATQSACASASAEPGHVMRAIGYKAPEAFETFRISFGIYTSKAELEKFISVLKEITDSQLSGCNNNGK